MQKKLLSFFFKNLKKIGLIFLIILTVIIAVYTNQKENLGQKQNRVYSDLNDERFDKRRDKRERQIAPQPDGTNIEFQKQHAFRRLNGTGEVLMLLDHQVLDQIVF